MSKISQLIITVGLIFSACTMACAPSGIEERHPSDEFHLVEGPSGWKLALYRYFPEEGSTKKRHPVLVCHGISSNKWSWDLEPEHSIAFFLKKRGFEVWMVNLRGSDKGTKPHVFSRKFGYDWTFDDYVNEDLPTVIEYVKQKSGSPRVHWIGHSMGTMVMYAYAGTKGDSSIQSIVAVASPVSFDIPTTLWRFLKENAHFVRSVNFVPSKIAALIASPFGRVPIELFDFAIWNPENLSPRLIKKLMTLAVDNISGGVIRQFALFVETGKFTSYDGKIDYLENMKNISVPMLFISGNLDNLAPPHNVYPAFEKAGSREKKFVVASQATGFSADYGHVDIILSDPAKEDIYPLIAQWLEVHDYERSE